MSGKYNKVDCRSNFATEGIAMKKRLGLFWVVLVLSGVTLCAAKSDIPNLQGTWTTKAEGGVMLKGQSLGATTHWDEKATTLSGEITFETQQGRVLRGYFKSAKATEKFIAIIGLDNKTLYTADTDGFLDGRIIDKDTIEFVYRHVSDTDSVVASGVMKRKK
jgi:hypothetical protein